MPNARITNAIELSTELATGTVPDDDMIGVPILRWMSRASDDIPPWWSFSRDIKLREFWKNASHLATIMYTAQTLLVGAPLRIEAKDASVTSHVDQAELLTDVLMNVSEFGDTLYVAKRKFVEDYLGTDNGGFMEVIGAGPPDGPIEGLPIAVRHLDSWNCWRTSSHEFPVVYHDPYDGKAYKLHRTRVIYMSQMTSPIAQMNGVGFCAVSRAIQFARHLYDIYIHKQEKLGSRPISTILVGAGFKGGQIMKAVQVAQMAMNNQGLTRYSRAVGIGSDNTDATITPLTLNNFDPFDEETSVSLAVYGLAASFGIPIQEVWPAAGGRSGKAGDHQESRQRGKLPAEFNSELELQLGQKYLPPYLKAVHDYRDDYQDERRAVNQDIRARNRERDLSDGSITVQTSRQQMVDAGDITRWQYMQMELESGRLADGRTVGVLFYATDKVIRTALDLGVENPTSVFENDKAEMLLRIDEARSRALAELASASAGRNRDKYTMCIAALDWLEKKYTASIAPALMNITVSPNGEDLDDNEDEELEEAGDEPALDEGSPSEENEVPEEDGPRQPSQTRPARQIDDPTKDTGDDFDVIRAWGGWGT